MDGKAGRKMAANTGVLAMRKGIVPLVKPQLEKLAATGYFLSEEIIAAAMDALANSDGRPYAPAKVLGSRLSLGRQL